MPKLVQLIVVLQYVVNGVAVWSAWSRAKDLLRMHVVLPIARLPDVGHRRVIRRETPESLSVSTRVDFLHLFGKIDVVVRCVSHLLQTHPLRLCLQVHPLLL